MRADVRLKNSDTISIKWAGISVTRNTGPAQPVNHKGTEAQRPRHRNRGLPPCDFGGRRAVAAAHVSGSRLGSRSKGAKSGRDRTGSGSPGRGGVAAEGAGILVFAPTSPASVIPPSPGFGAASRPLSEAHPELVEGRPPRLSTRRTPLHEYGDAVRRGFRFPRAGGRSPRRRKAYLRYWHGGPRRNWRGTGRDPWRRPSS